MANGLPLSGMAWTYATGTYGSGERQAPAAQPATAEALAAFEPVATPEPEYVLVLTDSRHRATTGRRAAYVFDASHDGAAQAWDLVLAAECPDEAADYAGYRDNEGGDTVASRCETFNAFWAEYGWYLGEQEAAPDQYDAPYWRPWADMDATDRRA